MKKLIGIIIFLFGLSTPFLGAQNSKTTSDVKYLEKVYRSKLDSSLQPYIVKLPQNYDKQKEYPLIGCRIYRNMIL